MRVQASTPADPKPGARRWADLRLRALSALVLLPVGLGCLWVGGWLWAALVALATVGLGFEWSALCQKTGAQAPSWLPVAQNSGVLLIVVGIAAVGFPVQAIAAIAGGAIAEVIIDGRIVRALGLPYLGLPAIALIWLRGASDVGRGDVLFVLLVVWATDIAAYLVGRLVGGPRLAPSISPGKTWSGAAGGLLGALLVGWAAGLAALPCAALLGVAAQAGDLMESAIKRRFGVKDSGRLIPGHGGLLDRLDGVLAAAPVAALLALATGRGVGFSG